MKKDRRKKDIKSKLMAAIAMLMVSCIMLVSSTYAWFTLSTAPEVTGISTAIGANGNLEMALLPNGGSIAEALENIGNATGNLTTVEANTTWGNLVDLSDDSYGLDKIALFPAALAASGNTLSENYLGTPVYGADGRFIQVKTTAGTAIYKSGAFGSTGFGVRAVGTSSGMSAHELAYREALSAANNAFNTARTQTMNGASQGGSALASLAVSKATGTTTFDQDDVNNLKTAYTSIKTALASIETAMKQYIIAYALSRDGVNENTYLSLLDTLKGMNLSEMSSYAAGTNIGTYIEKLTTMKTDVQAKLDGLATMTTASYTWDQISPYVSPLADTNGMLLNGHPMSYWMEKDGESFVHLSELASNASNLVLEINSGVTFTNSTGQTVTSTDTGYYAQMADFTEGYTTPVTISGIQFGGSTVDKLNATMRVHATANPAYLPAAKNAAGTYSSNVFSGGGSTLSDFYGYIIDMAFRTNAADSYLQLQTGAIDRIYDDNDSTNTMGGGSNMSYTLSAADVKTFSTDDLENLMSYIRVVFFDPTNMEILGYARLDADTANAVQNEDGSFTVSMDLRMWDNALNDNKGAWAENSAIAPLVQNVAKAVSTLVYLDGEKLTNADVANAELKGTMNIQFSSSAELIPMEYGDLLNGNVEEKSEYTVTVNGVQAEQKVAKGASYSYNIPSEYSGYTITVKMGGTEVPDAVSGGVITIANVTGNIEITATAPASGG